MAYGCKKKLVNLCSYLTRISRKRKDTKLQENKIRDIHSAFGKGEFRCNGYRLN